MTNMTQFNSKNNDIVGALNTVLAKRKAQSDPSSSYVASLHNKGLNKILEKVGEEAIEVILAAKDAQFKGNNDDVISEAADVVFHLMVMLSHLDTDFEAVLDKLAERFDVSGLDEKASRGNI